MTGDETRWRIQPDIPYMGVEGGLPDPEIRGGGFKKIFFRPFGPFGLKIRAGPLHWIRHC